MLAAVLALSVAAGCGESSRGPAVVRVGTTSIGSAAVAHWQRVFEQGEDPRVASVASRGTPRQRAAGFLIGTAWLIGEAERVGSAVPESAVERTLAERKVANGEAEFEAQLKETGRTVSDVKLEVEAELARVAIGRYLRRRASRIDEKRVQHFYRRTRALFRTPEVRLVDLIENLPSAAAARALVGRIGAGRRFARRAFREALQRSAGNAAAIQGKERLVRAIFTARRGQLSRPLRLNHAWTVFIVRKITPSSVKPLAAVREAIVTRLVRWRLHALARQFEREYVARWKSRTRCRAGWIVQGCAQYAGPSSNVSLFSDE